jgi:hypothetical protein
MTNCQLQHYVPRAVHHTKQILKARRLHILNLLERGELSKFICGDVILRTGPDGQQ